MARHNVIYIEAWCARDIPLGLACTRHGFDTSISLANRFKLVTCLVHQRQFQRDIFPSSSRHQIEQIPRKTFSILPVYE